MTETEMIQALQDALEHQPSGEGYTSEELADLLQMSRKSVVEKLVKPLIKSGRMRSWRELRPNFVGDMRQFRLYALVPDQPE